MLLQNLPPEKFADLIEQALAQFHQGCPQLLDTIVNDGDPDYVPIAALLLDLKERMTRQITWPVHNWPVGNNKLAVEPQT